MLSKDRAGWMREAKWGIFMHFLAAPASSSLGAQVTAQEWNRRVDHFDVQALAKQLVEIQAGYAVITIGQNSGHYCSPNAAYDRFTGLTPSKCSRRDLVADLYEALAPHNIPLMVYAPSHAPMADPAAVRALGCIPPWDFLKWSPGSGVFRPEEADSDTRISAFQRKWEAILSEWSTRWGKNVRGWWIDGCYYCDKLYDHPDEPNFSSFAAAMRAGNPDSAVCWNPGVKYPPYTHTAEEDYTAGEINEPQEVDSPGSHDKQAQWHLLSFIGKYWGRGPVRFGAEEAIALTRSCTDYGGAFTWDVPPTENGLLIPEAMEVLRPLGAALARTRGAAIQSTPKLVKARIQIKRPPEIAENGALIAGQAVLQLCNPHEVPLAGSVQLVAEPAGAFTCAADTAYTLAPGAEVCRTVEINLTSAGCNLEGREVVILREGDARRYRQPLPVRKALTLPVVDGRTGLAALPARALSFNGESLGELCLGLRGGNLELLVRARDTAMLQTAMRWDASCLELFVSAGDEAAIQQYFLVPATAQGQAGIYRSIPNGSAAEQGLKYETTQTAGGYEGYASLPLTELLKLEKMPVAFLLEVGVSAAPDGATYQRASLFGSVNPASTSANYARVR